MDEACIRSGLGATGGRLLGRRPGFHVARSAVLCRTPEQILAGKGTMRSVQTARFLVSLGLALALGWGCKSKSSHEAGSASSGGEAGDTGTSSGDTMSGGTSSGGEAGDTGSSGGDESPVVSGAGGSGSGGSGSGSGGGGTNAESTTGSGGSGGEPVCEADTRDCTSSLDNNCNGTPDDEEEACFVCPLEDTRACNEHPGFDGVGLCTAGTSECVLAEDGASVDWGPCEDSVGPSALDCQSSEDHDCNGEPDEGEPNCACSYPDTDDECGPNTWSGAPTPVGICQPGTRECSSDGTWGSCSGYQEPMARDCTSGLDNDCNGTPDDEDDSCTACGLSDTQACDTGQDGVCAAGTQTCVLVDNDTAVDWGPCEQNDSATTRDCRSSLDNDCNSSADSGEPACNGCGSASVNDTQACNTGLDGICAAGTETCVYKNSFTFLEWSGDCVQDQQAGTRDCRTTTDNNCNGQADSAETPCVCAQGATRTCAAGGVGICAMGVETCEFSGNNSSSDWGACVQNQPEAQACGPLEPDSNCDGIVGNAASGCTILMSLFADYTPECIEGDGKLGNPLAFSVRATGSNPGGWSWLTSFYVFTTALPGTVAVRNCSQDRGSVQGPVEYVHNVMLFAVTEEVPEPSTLALFGGRRRLRGSQQPGLRVPTPRTDHAGGQLQPLGVQRRCLCTDGRDSARWVHVQ